MPDLSKVCEYLRLHWGVPRVSVIEAMAMSRECGVLVLTMEWRSPIRPGRFAGIV